MPLPFNTQPPTDGQPEPGMLAGALKKLMPAMFGGEEPEAEAPPDPYADHKQMVERFEAFYKECFDGREEFERLWWRNILYVLHRHWIYYDRATRTSRDKRLAKWIPKPVTNMVGETVETIVATFQAVQLGAIARPNGNDPINVQTAETADRLEKPMAQAHEMPAMMMLADWWACVTGGALLHVWWDPNAEKSMRFVPFEACAACGKTVRPDQIEESEGICPECQESSLFEPALDEAGEPVGESVPDGSGRTDTVSFLEAAWPLTYENFKEIPGIIRLRWRSKNWYQRFHKDRVKELNFEKMTPERSLQLLKAIATQTGTGGTPYVGSGSFSAETEGITEAEWWAKPSQDYPGGLVARFILNGGQWQVWEVEEESLPGPIPHEDALGNKLWPWVMYAYKIVGGRSLPEAPINPIIAKNDQLNQIDALIQLCMQRTANPVWLEPKGADVQKFSGEPGLVVQYNPLVQGGKPERIEGSSVPAYVLQYRSQLVEDIERLAGTHDILKGTKPAGVEAFAAMQLLVERSQSRFGPVLANRGDAYRQWFALALEMERQYGPQERTLSVLGANDAWTFVEFQNADLQGAISIIVEDGSQTPKTNLGERAAIEHLAQLQLLPKDDPDTQYEILRSFGQTKLVPQLDVHTRAALQEQDEFEKWAAASQLLPPDPATPFQPDPTNPAQPQIDPMSGQPMPAQPMWSTPPPGTRMSWHNDVIHAAQHRKWLNGDKMRQLVKERPELVPVLDWFLGQHDFEIAMAQQAMMGAGPGGPGGPGGPKEEQGAGRAMQNSNQNAGAVPAGA